MKTSQPFHTFDPQKYIKRRYSPLVVTVVEDDVEQLFKQSNLTFTDFLAAFVEYDNNPMRIITGDMLRQETQEELLMNVRNDTFLFSQSFAFQEFEDSDATDPQLSPIPDLFPKAIHYPSKESMNPPWFSLFAEKLLKSMQFTDFDFCDLPTCIVYATKSNSQIPLKTPTDVIHSIAFPQWMNEFVSGIPIVRVIVYDGLVTSASNTSKGQFKEIYHLCFRTRHIDMSAPMDKVTLQNLFKYDTHLTKSDDFFSDVGQSDVKSVKDFLNILHKIITADIEITIKSHDFEIEGMNTVSNKLKNLFSKNVPERVTDYHSIPWKIIIHQKIASLHMILGNYDNSRKSFHEASNLYSSNKQHNDLRLHCLLLHTFSCINKQNFLSHLKDGITYLMSHIAEARSVRFLIMVPLLVAEFYSSLFDYNQSCQLYKLAINKIKKLWSGNIDIRSTILGLLYERLAGLTQDKNHSLLYTSIAAKTYLSCEQIPHALRCYIWLLKLLPNNQWVLLSQTAWLEKAKILCNLNQFMRALNNLKELLALPNLHQSLHEQVMSSFWVPYNQTSLIKEEKKINIRSLLDIKGIQIVDQSEPEYFGLNNDDFMEMINEYDKHAKQALGLTSSVSFDSWYEDSNDYSKKKKIINKVGIGNEIIVIISVYNHYKFSIHLNSAILQANFVGNNEENIETYKIEQINNINIPGLTKKPIDLKFKFTPLLSGKYTIDKFNKSYWGHINTEVNCEPLTFTSIENIPQITMDIIDFPSECYLGQCYKFYISITNNGNFSINGYDIIYDKPSVIVPLENKYKIFDKIGVFSYRKEIKPNETITNEFIVQISSNLTSYYRFFVAIEGNQYAYAEKKVITKPIMRVEACIIKKQNETTNMIFRSSVTSINKNIEIIGFINKNGYLLKTIKNNNNNQCINNNKKFNFFGYTSEETIEKTDEWRTKVMGKAPMSILFKVDNEKLYGQFNLNVMESKSKYSLKFIMPNECKIGQKINAKIMLLNPSNENIKLFVEPAQFELVGVVDERSQVVGCRWIGKRRILLSNLNEFKADLSFITQKGGIYKIHGFYISENNDFSNPKLIELTQRIFVSSRNSIGPLRIE